MFALSELIDILIMTLGVSYIFSDILASRAQHAHHDPIKYWSSRRANNLLFALYATAPAIILHELAHKVVAISLGFQAVFHAAYSWLGLGIILKLLNTGIIFFVPGYVSISGGASGLQQSLIAFAGPGTNLFLFILATILLKYQHKFSKKVIDVLLISRQLNLFLFFLNMLPIPPFDGFSFFKGLWSFLF